MKPELKKELTNFLAWLDSKKEIIAWAKSHGTHFGILEEYDEFLKDNKSKQYVRCYYAGIMFSETTDTLLTEDFELPKGSYCYEFYDKYEGGVPMNFSPKHYIGDILTLADVKEFNFGGKFDILISNMEGNNWDKVVKTIAGNYVPLEETDIVKSSITHFREQKLKRIMNE